jgi:hypothetical protein
MANEYRGEVEVDLGGNTYTMRPTMNAIAHLEAKGGSIRKLLSKFIKDDGSGRTVENDEWAITDVMRILQAGFLGQGRDAPAPKDLGDLVMQTGAQALVVPCVEFLANCLNPPKREAAEADRDESPTDGAEA